MSTAHMQVNDFIDTMDNLIAVMKHEIELVKKRDYEDLKRMQSKKNRLGLAYDEKQTLLQQNPKVLDHLNDAEKADLREKFADFRNVLADNMLAIRAAHDSTEKVMQAVVATIRKRRGITGEPRSALKPRSGYAVYTAPTGVEYNSVNRAL